MVQYQKYGVLFLTVVFAILQKFKFQIFRLFVLHKDSGSNETSYLNLTETYFEEERISKFLFKCLVVNNCISVLPCICLAAWSDRHGRKLLLYLPFLGSLLTDVFLLIVLFVRNASLDLLFISEAAYGLCGGTVLMGLGCLCYVTDSSDHRLRTVLIGIFFGFFNIMPLIEMLLQYYWIPHQIQLTYKNLVVIGISVRVFLSLCFILYIKFCVLESVFVLGSYHGNPWVNLLTPINVSDTVSCVFKRRLDNMRFFIVTLSAIFIFYCLTLFGNLVIFPLHFRYVYKWRYQDLIIFSAIFAVCQTGTLWISAYSALKCRLLDINLGTYGMLSLAISCLALTFSQNSWTSVIGSFFGLGSLLVPTSVISVLSKLIERVETGSMYAGIGFLLLITQLVAVPSYEALAQICIEAGMSQVIFLLSFGFTTFGVLLFIYLKHNISPDLLGHLNPTESLALINRRGQIEQLFET